MAHIYLDHSATTLPDNETLEFFHEQLINLSGNPASLHRLGQAAAKSIKNSKRIVAESFGCRNDEIVWTSGGSESINMALKGYVAANPKRGMTIVTAAGEHAATNETLKYLTGQGYRIRIVPLNPDGRINLDELEAAIDEDTILITCLHVNNETGAVQPVEEIVRLRNKKRPIAAIHLDGVQACGKIPVHFARLGVDLFSGSGHKFGSPKGIGFLLIRHGIRVKPLIHGGGQQNGLRSGTENAPLIATLARSCAEAASNLAVKQDHCRQLRQQLLDELGQSGVAYAMLSPPDGIPQILNLSFPGLRGETLQHALELSDIFISTGSACSSHKKGSSEVLLAMGLSKDVADCSIRISLSAANTPAEIALTARTIAEACQKYRR